ncbi:MAG TPA: TonB-dependent receptor [Pyrinomonadaceae bacterium]|jgi:Cna protein B-type domain.|nr:TonB-dependent receptor [Pyrinomonadaceae bacterium]
MTSSKCILRSIALATFFFTLTSLVAGQDYRGKVQGSVKDENGGAILGAQVVLRNVKTGVEVTRNSDNEGRYVFDFVDPGDYTLTAEQSGFKKAVQENVVVRVRGDISVDLKMAVGGVTETVTVEAAPVAVQFNSSSTLLTIENKVIDQLPIRGRNPYNVATLDPTVSPGTGSTSNENRPYHHAYASDIDVGGQTTRANDVLLDGVPLVSSYKSSYTPALDAVQEVTFQKNAIDSEYGYSAGGVIVLNMKSGTNDFHGTVIGNWRNPRFNALTDPTIKRTVGADETNFRGTNLKIYGGTIGGPIIKNKLFTFTSYEHWNDASPLPFTLTVPTPLERTGDFSQSTRNGVIRTIFDPLTSTGTSGTRTAFTGNKIPSNRFDPTALKLLAEMPLPNLPGSQDNLQGFRINETTYWNFSERVDWNISEKLKTFIRYGQFKAHLLESNPTDKKLMPLNGSNRYGLSIAADTVYTISPKWVLNLRANFHQLTDEFAAAPSLIGKEGIAELFPTNFWTSLYTFDQYYYPAFDVGSSRLGRPGREFWQHPQGYGGSVRLNYYEGAHSLKFGGEYRVDKGKGARFEPLTFNIKQALTANANSSPNLNTSGSEWATFLLGYIDNASIAARVPIQEAVTLGYASYVMDDYKVTSRLTLNLGLRWEYEPGPVDRGNRISQQLDLTQPIPEMQATPPAIPSSVTTLLNSKGQKQLFNGAWIFTSADNRNAWNRKVMNLLPRLGFAYRINDKSVVRFGWGRYISPSSKIRDPLGDFVNQYAGFSTSTPAATLAVVAPATGPIPRATLSNPYPTAITPIQQPLGQSLGRYTNLGNSIGAANNATNGIDEFQLRPAVNDRLSFSYQREIWAKFVLDFEYFHNHENNLPYAVDLNMADPSFSYETPKSLFNQSVTNPFFNYLTPDKFPGTLRTQSNITIGGLLRPYPQYGVINQTNTSGRGERLHSFEIQAQRPYAKGVSILFAYAYQQDKTQEFFDDLATFARRFEWRDTDSPRQRFTSAVRWDLPFGKGRTYLNSAPTAVDMALGGWSLTTTTRIYSGRPLFFTQNLIVDGNPKINNPTNAMWFDTSIFHQVPTSTDPALPPNLHRRDNPWTYPGLNGPGVWQTDGTLSKSFNITERFKLEVRVEAYNLFNRIQFANPTVDFTSANFGKVTTKLVAYNGREVQYGLRLVF